MVKVLSNEARGESWAPCIDGFDQEGLNRTKDNNYIKYISAYDHWLSEEEEGMEEKNILIDEGDPDYNIFLHKKHTQYKKSLFDFYSDLYDNTKVHTELYSYYARAITCDVEFDSKKEYLSHVLLSINGDLPFEIMIPEHQARIQSDYGFTLNMLVSKDCPQGLEAITKIAKKHNLYILD